MTEEYFFVLSCDAGDTRSFEVAPQTYLIIYSFCKLIWNELEKIEIL